MEWWVYVIIAGIALLIIAIFATDVIVFIIKALFYIIIYTFGLWAWILIWILQAKGIIVDREPKSRNHKKRGKKK